MSVTTDMIGSLVICYIPCLGATQQAQNICVTCIQRRPNVFDVGPALYKCYTNVFCLLDRACHWWHNTGLDTFVGAYIHSQQCCIWMASCTSGLTHIKKTMTIFVIDSNNLINIRVSHSGLDHLVTDSVTFFVLICIYSFYTVLHVAARFFLIIVKMWVSPLVHDTIHLILQPVNLRSRLFSFVILLSLQVSDFKHVTKTWHQAARFGNVIFPRKACAAPEDGK